MMAGREAPHRSRSLVGRSFLNVEADRPISMPYMHLVNSSSEARLSKNTLEELNERLQETGRCLKSVGGARASSAKKEVFVYVGAPGIGFAFLKLASIEKDRQLGKALEAADQFISQDVINYGHQQARQYPQIEPSLLSGPAGVCIVRALQILQKTQLELLSRGISLPQPALVRKLEAADSVDKSGGGAEDVDSSRNVPIQYPPAQFVKVVKEFKGYADTALSSEVEDEWLYGRTGYLFGCLFLEYLSPGSIGEDLTNRIVEKIISSGRKRAEASGKSRPALRYAWHNKEYTGAVHGYFGILYMLMQVKAVRQDEATLALIRNTLDWLLDFETEQHNWPAAVGDRDAYLCHFCHGAPGAVFAYKAAAQLFEDRSYKLAAERAGDCVWRYGLLRKGPGICHGIGGSGYALLAVYQLTQHPVWLDRAAEFTLKIFDAKLQADSNIPDHPYSLFEGLAGAMCLLVDLIKSPESAAYPFFDIGF